VKYDNDDCMYKFRTKKCCNKKCRNGKTCFNFHSRVMSRRVPKQIGTRRTLFNYIPHECPEYKKRKKCALGNECHLAHGWLEIIYHPLLFKTKLCESSSKKGVCRKYGIYCAKAHNENEVRNLVSIYGKDWKRHYEAFQVCESAKESIKKENDKPSKQADVLDSSQSSGLTVDDDFPNVKSVGMTDYSSLIYGGSPLFVPTPSVSPCQSIVLCSNSGDGLPMDHIPAINLNDFGHLSSVEGGEVGMYTKISDEGGNIVASNRKKTQGKYSLFDDCCPWEFDWSSSKDSSPKESVCSCSGSYDSESSSVNGCGSSTSGCTVKMFSTDQDSDLLKTKEDCICRDAFMTNSVNLSDDQAMSKSLLEFDQQDWELKLRENGHGNKLNADSMCPTQCKDEYDKLVDQSY